jgi:hypothetical protein
MKRSAIKLCHTIANYSLRASFDLDNAVLSAPPKKISKRPPPIPHNSAETKLILHISRRALSPTRKKIPPMNITVLENNLANTLGFT